MKKIAGLMIILLVVLAAVGAAADEYDSCGTNVEYLFTENTKILEIGLVDPDQPGIITKTDWSDDVKKGTYKIILQNGVTEIGEGCFKKFTTVAQVILPDGFKVIGKEAFYEDYDLQVCKLPNTLEYIGDSAFYSCINLKSVTLPQSLTYLGEYAFCGCVSFKSINIPEKITEIPDGLCYKCWYLTTVTISSELKRVGACAFAYCDEKLQSIKLPESVTVIDEYAFYTCKSLKTINIPDGVTEILWFTFCGCDSLESINIPDGVTYIGDANFSYCALKTVTLPASLTKLAEECFQNCDNLIQVTVKSRNVDIDDGVFDGSNNLTLHCYRNSTTEAYARKKQIKYEILDWLVSFNPNGGTGTMPLFSVDKGEKLKLPECTFTPPEGKVFDTWDWGAPGTEIDVIMDMVVTAKWKDKPAASDNLTPTVGALKFKLSGSKAVVTGPKDKNAKKLTIPSTIKANGKTYKVTEIEAGAFKGMKKLTTVTIGANIKTIGKSAFQSCAKLKTITIKTKKLTASSVKSNAFKGIYKKATFKCPKGKAAAYKKILLKKGAPKTCKFK